MIADTSFIIDLLRCNREALEKAEEMEKNNTGYSIGTPTLYELWLGVAKSNSREKEEILDIIESQTIHKMDKKSSLEAGNIQRKLLNQGERIGHVDALIAGIAKEGSTGKVLTDNTEEFEKVDGLEVVNYK